MDDSPQMDSSPVDKHDKEVAEIVANALNQVASQSLKFTIPERPSSYPALNVEPTFTDVRRAKSGAMPKRENSVEDTSENNVRSSSPHKERISPLLDIRERLLSDVRNTTSHQPSSGESMSHSPTFVLPEDDHSSDQTQKPTGAAFHGPHRSKSEGKLFSPWAQHAGTKISKRESLKAQKKHYRTEKKRATKELFHTLKDPSVVVMADWLKIRGTLKSWTKLWCVLKPGLFVLYKSHKQKSRHWVGTILLNTTELIERPSKKGGFCFKLFHPLDQSIWAPKGPKGETMGAITQPLPYSYLIFRTPSEAAGKCWMDALELALRCSNLLIRSMTKDDKSQSKDQSMYNQDVSFLTTPGFRGTAITESDCEKHFIEDDWDDDFKTDKEEDNKSEKSDGDDSSSVSEEEEDRVCNDDLLPIETPYVENTKEELGEQGDACQTEEVPDENKSIIWSLVKQVRPGMDLSKVVLPTFILEPRSLLEKFADYYYHADMLSEAVLQEDPFSRMKGVVRWYLSGFYKKPKGLKKPYNPILGETFRCYWRHPKTNSRTFYIAEQISHHPPVTAFCVTNRKDGFSINGSVLAKSKFYGNSLSAIMDGAGRLTFLKRGEDYCITMPYAYCKGILIGTLTMELGGKVHLDCEKTGYRTELEFKLKPFLGSSESCNRITGKIKLGSETLATIDGHWDQEIYIKDKSTGVSDLFFSPTTEMKSKRLKRHTVPPEDQGDFESEKLWQHVTAALKRADQTAATNEKFILEDAQRKATKERKAKMVEWVPKLFERDSITGEWVYKYADSRPWDPINDVLQYEYDYVVQTKTRRKVPLVRATSILSVNSGPDSARKHRRQPSSERARAARIKRTVVNHLRSVDHESGSSTPDLEHRPDSDSSESEDDSVHKEAATGIDPQLLNQVLVPLQQIQKKNSQVLTSLQGHMARLERAYTEGGGVYLQNRDWLILAVILIFQTILHLFFK